MKMILLLTAAVLLDLLIGDPTFIPHPIRGIGWLISSMEKLLRRLFTDLPLPSTRCWVFAWRCCWAV